MWGAGARRRFKEFLLLVSRRVESADGAIDLRRTVVRMVVRMVVIPRRITMGLGAS